MSGHIRSYQVRSGQVRSFQVRSLPYAYQAWRPLSSTSRCPHRACCTQRNSCLSTFECLLINKQIYRSDWPGNFTKRTAKESISFLPALDQRSYLAEVERHTYHHLSDNCTAPLGRAVPFVHRRNRDRFWARHLEISKRSLYRVSF